LRTCCKDLVRLGCAVEWNSGDWAKDLVCYVLSGDSKVGGSVMGRAPCCDDKMGLKKGPWTPDEDQKLVAYIQQHGHGSWRALPKNAGEWTLDGARPYLTFGSEQNDAEILVFHACRYGRLTVARLLR
jgi:hypothetical protein